MAGNGNYEPVSSSATTVTFVKANQSSLTLTSTSGTYGVALTLATSGGTTSGSVTYVVTGTGCSITSGALSKSSAGDCSVTATMAGNGNYEPVSSLATTVSFGQATQSALTVTSTSGTYGSALTLTTSGGTTNGSVTYVATGTGCSITSGALSKSAAGDCAVTATMAGNSDYNAVSSSATTVTFARIALTVTADAKSKQYGATDPSLTHTITSGALVGQDALSGSLTRASGEDVGTYAISQGTLANSNYDITYAGANLTVTQRPITVTAASVSKQYGAVDPTFTHSVTTGSLVGQDALTGSLSRTSGENVGSYAIAQGALANANYDITFVPANLSITQRPITVTAAAKSKEYGASDPALTHSVTTGSLIGQDALSGSLTRVSGESVGSYAILRGTVENTNYDITYVGALLSVSQRPITVTAAAKSKEYGASDPALTYSVTAGSLVGSDTLTGTLSRASGDLVGAYAINQGTLTNSNYDITYAGANLTVTQRPITVTADAKSKQYGASDPALTHVITSGSLLSGDALSGTLSRASGEDVGTYAISQGTLANSNYDITYAGANLTVTQRPITVTADSATKQYGASDPTFTFAITTGLLVGQDALTGSLSRTSGTNVGSFALTIGTLANANYDITFVPSNMSITQRPITVTAAAKSKEYGASDPTLTYSVTTGSLVGQDAMSGSLTRVSGESVGSYAILRGTLDNTNYDITYAGALLSVSQHPITVTADAKLKEYGASDPTLTYGLTTGSLVGSDTLTGTLSRASGDSVGT
jgi:flagellar basal body rod protein FlgG